MIATGLRTLLVPAAVSVSAAFAVFANDVPRIERLAVPGEKAVYMVLMPETEVVHVTELPSLQRCREAIQFVEGARCIEAVKPPSGEWPAAIRKLVPPRADEHPGARP